MQNIPRLDSSFCREVMAKIILTLLPTTDYGGSHVSNTTATIHDNSDGNYARTVKTALDSSYTLKNVGNKFYVSYTIGEYIGQKGLSNPTLYFNVYIGNELDVSTQSTYQKDMTQIIT